MSFLAIFLAFLCGFLARQMSLPPLVGYLIAGFALNYFGFQSDSTLEAFSDFGITLMLFTIGLKVDLRTLARPNIWGATMISKGVWVIALMPVLFGISLVLGRGYFDLSLYSCALISFALSFSSTVCAIKVLEDNSELRTQHGNLVIGVLIMQDLIAVLFLLATTGKTPSMWAPALLLLVFARPILSTIFDRSGHGELVPLWGIVLAIGGATLFEFVGLKGDLGALVLGMLMAGVAGSSELYKSLVSFKDLFLIGFFLSIGLTALPTFEMFLIAASLLLILPFKFITFYWVFSRFGCRARTAFLSALLLSNFSEFGLIVASVALDNSWLADEWLVIIALAAALSFVATSVIYRYAHPLFVKNRDWLLRVQGDVVCDEEGPTVTAQNVEVLIVGMGRVGMGAYKELDKNGENNVWGLEVDHKRIEYLNEKGIRTLSGDADDCDFWEQLELDKLKLVMLALPSMVEMRNILGQLKTAGYQGKVSAVARYADEQKELIAHGADVAFNYYAEVGTGFAEESKVLLAR